MKILHVIATMDPAAGGPPMVVARLAAGQAGLGHRVAVLSYRVPGVEERLGRATARFPHYPAVQERLLPPPTRWERLFAGAARRELASLVSQMDVVHLHGTWDSILRVAAQEARRHGVKYVVAPHGMLDPWSLAQKAWKKRLALLTGYRRMLNRASFLHLLSAQEERLSQPLGLRCPVHIIPNGIFLEEMEPLPPTGSFYERHPELEGRPFVLFLSRLHYKKGLDYLAEAFALVAKELAHVHLVVAGPDDGMGVAFDRQIEQQGLAARVHRVGPVYGTDKLTALVDAACFCLPSRQEGFSVAILEALACGLPVVISENCRFPEVAAAGAGKVVPLDAPTLAGALLELLRDRPRLQEMGRAGRGLIRSRYTLPVLARACIAAYEGERCEHTT